MASVTRPSAERSSTWSFPVMSTPTGPRNRRSLNPPLSGDETNGITPAAISPASNPPKRSRGRMAYIAKPANGRRSVDSAIGSSRRLTQSAKERLAQPG